jgi:flavin reductase (DIM6/NTAB) family NADH-FMN oxidoreductase RutF/rubredoxin
MINTEAFFKVNYGLYIVSSGNESERNGFISNSVFQVTAEPPQFAVCCSKANFSADLIKRAGCFSVSVLRQEVDADLFGKFGYKSGRDTNKFNGTRFIKGLTGAPVLLDDTVAWIECRTRDVFDVGTHLIFIGEVVQAEVADNLAEPLTYSFYRKVKKGVAPKNAPTYIDQTKLEKKETTADTGRYQCPACGYIYEPSKGDPDAGIKAGTAFEDLPDSWVCPLCGSGKADFIKLDN